MAENFSIENIKEIAKQSSEESGFFLVDLIIRGNERNRIIEVFIDGEQNITADDCAKVSKEIESKLDNVLDNYRLDVSSPGTNRPLLYLKQFPKHLNRKFEISYTDNNQTKTLTGKLLEINGDYLIFLSNNKQVMISFNNIKKAKVIPAIS